MESLFLRKESLNGVLVSLQGVLDGVLLPHKEDWMQSLFRQNPCKSRKISHWTHASVQQIFLISDGHVFPPGRVSDPGPS